MLEYALLTEVSQFVLVIVGVVGGETRFVGLNSRAKFAVGLYVYAGAIDCPT
jgi:hypothetical protein